MTAEGKALTRVCAIDLDKGKVIYYQLVKPPRETPDYLTPGKFETDGTYCTSRFCLGPDLGGMGGSADRAFDLAAQMEHVHARRLSIVDPGTPVPGSAHWRLPPPRRWTRMTPRVSTDCSVRCLS
jgi:hypothetical protein